MGNHWATPVPETPWPVVSRSAEGLEEIWVPRHQLEDGLRELVQAVLPGAALLFGVLTVTQGAVLFITNPGGQSTSVAVSGCVGLLLIALALGLSKFELPLFAANPLAFVVALAAASNTVLILVASREPLFTLPLFLFLPATSMLFLERRWFVGWFLTAIALWGVAGRSVYRTEEWPYYALSLVCVVGVTVWMFSTRYSTLKRLTYFQLQEEKRKSLLLVRVDDAFKSSAELFELTVRDPLTGAYNRRFLAQLRTELEAQGKTCGALLIDLDGFKEINDKHGHAAGDRALQRMAHFIRRQARSEDRLIRYGGDEFLLLLEVENEEAVGPIAERFREVASQEAPLPFSMGAVGRRSGESLRSMLQRADQLMYADKTTKHSYERLGPTGERKANPSRG